MERDALYGKRVVVLGFARQGRALARWLPTVGAEVVVSDQASIDSLNGDLADFPDVEFIMGGHPSSLLDGADMLCVSGGVPLDLPIVQAAVKQGIPLTNDAQLFLERCPSPVIAITGSAGKTTTTTLVGEMLKRTGVPIWVGGNIGYVLLDTLKDIEPDHHVVMELSSFQLEIMSISPHISAILNITPNHLDRHGTMENYVRAKAQIMLHQNPDDLIVLGRDNSVCRQLAEVAVSDVAWFSATEMVPDGAFMIGQRLVVTGMVTENGDPQVICERDEIPLRGDHNLLNVLAACAMAGAAGATPEMMAETIREFQGVEHRLEVVRVLDGVTYVNDSIATAPERVVAALHSYTEPVVLLLGGKDKNLPWEELLTLARSRTRHIVAFGHVADMVLSVHRKVGGAAVDITRVETLKDAVAVAQQQAQNGDVVLLSPGGTSYDAYRDFAERGEHFRQLVAEL